MAKPETVAKSLEYIEGMLHYLIDTGETPESYGGMSQSEADRNRKGKYRGHKMKIYNGRAIADQLSLEREGFILVRHDTRMKDFYDEDEVRAVYYKETEELVRETSGANRVLVFDHTLRSADESLREEKHVSGPVRNAHNDYTEWSGPQRVRDLLPDEAEELLKGRFAVVQTWRPINKSVQREPLAIADARSIGSNYGFVVFFIGGRKRRRGGGGGLPFFPVFFSFFPLSFFFFFFFFFFFLDFGLAHCTYYETKKEREREKREKLNNVFSPFASPLSFYMRASVHKGDSLEYSSVNVGAPFPD